MSKKFKISWAKLIMFIASLYFIISGINEANGWIACAGILLLETLDSDYKR